MMDAFKAFVDRWMQPSLIVGFLVVIYGAIIWGNNLTEEALRAAEERGKHNARIVSLEFAERQNQISMTEMTLILKQVVETQKSIQQMVIDHNREAEEWKRRIVINEQKNGAGR
jgi:hypothetical protein